MKIDRKDFVDALDIVMPAILNNALVPAHQCFMIDGSTVTTTDGALIIQTKLKEDTEMRCAVQAGPLLSLLKTITSKTITLEEDGAGNVLVKTPRGAIKGTFVALQSFTAPAVPQCSVITNKEGLADIVSAFNFCRYCASKNGLDVPYCGVQLRGDKVYGSDKYRIAQYTLKNPPLTVDIVIPVKFITALLKSGKSIINIDVANDYIVVELDGDTTICSGLLSGDYQNLDEYLDIGDGGEVVQFSEGLPKVLERHIAFIKGVESELKVTSVKIEGNVCTLESIDKSAGKLSETLELKTKHDKVIDFNINPLFLREIVKVSDTFTYKDGMILFRTESLIFACQED